MKNMPYKQFEAYIRDHGTKFMWITHYQEKVTNPPTYITKLARRDIQKNNTC